MGTSPNLAQDEVLGNQGKKRPQVLEGRLTLLQPSPTPSQQTFHSAVLSSPMPQSSKKTLEKYAGHDHGNG